MVLTVKKAADLLQKKFFPGKKYTAVILEPLFAYVEIHPYRGWILHKTYTIHFAEGVGGMPDYWFPVKNLPMTLYL